MKIMTRREDKNMAQRYRIRSQYEDPQSIEARIVTYCEACGEPICEGYDYYQFGNHAMCESCVDECRTTAEIPDEPWSWEDTHDDLL